MQVPPTWLRSIKAVRFPAPASAIASGFPPCPEPITIASYVCVSVNLTPHQLCAGFFVAENSATRAPRIERSETIQDQSLPNLQGRQLQNPDFSTREQVQRVHDSPRRHRQPLPQHLAMLPAIIARPPPTATHAPLSAPVTIRAESPTAAVRAGVLGSWSATNSTSANTLKMTTAQIEPMNANGESCRWSQPECAAHAPTAGAVSERRPATTPIPRASKRAIPGLIDSLSLLMVKSTTESNPIRKRDKTLARRIRDWQPDLKARVSRFGAHLDASSVFFHNSLRRIEPKSGAFANRFGCEERFKDVLQYLFRNSGTAVPNLHHGTIVIAICADAKIAFSAHRIDCVVDKVGPHLIQFTAKGTHQKWHFFVVTMHGNALLELVVQDRESGFESFNHIHVLEGRLIHERVLLDRAHEIRNS